MLNGPSSSGKSTLAAALQRRFAADGECWFVYAMDDYFAKVPFDWVHIALDLLEARERARGDRMSGQARAQYEDSYRYPAYDAEVDTGALGPEAAAAAVLAGWRARAG